MNEFQRLIAYLKILMCNLAVLHHNAVGEGWFEVHGELDRWQGGVSGYLDDLAERGIALGYQEPTIAEAVLAFQTDVLPAQPRGRDETYRLVMEGLRAAAGLMQAGEAGVPADVQNKLQEAEYYLNKEADYKLARALGEAQKGPGQGHRQAPAPRQAPPPPAEYDDD